MYEFDEEQAMKLEKLLQEAVISCFLADVQPETPMTEVRERAELAGKYLGRIYAVVGHEGPVTADIAMVIRQCETKNQEKLLAIAQHQFGPSGLIRERFNQRVQEDLND